MFDDSQFLLHDVQAHQSTPQKCTEGFGVIGSFDKQALKIVRGVAGILIHLYTATLES